jgi:hypothetical protein
MHAMIKILRPLFLAIAFAPALSYAAAETYVGDTSTTIGGAKTHGRLELKVRKSKISGRVFSPALSHGFRVNGLVNKAGRFSLRALDKSVKGRLSGTLRSGKLRGRGWLTTAGQFSAKVELQGRTRLLTYNPDDITGVYVMTPEDRWDSSLYSYVEVHIDKQGDHYHWDVYFAGKPGDHSDNVEGTMPLNSWGDKTTFDYVYRVPGPIALNEYCDVRFYFEMLDVRGKLGGRLNLYQSSGWRPFGRPDSTNLPDSTYVVEFH